MRVMFYCQHVLGIGHWVRSSSIVRALASHAQVLLVNGGGEVAGQAFPSQVELASLPPLQTDANFSALETRSSTGTVEEIQQQRKRMLLGLFERFQPDLLVIELFPFGRKRFAFELIPLLDRARADSNRPQIVCSLRDILVAKKDQQAYEERVFQIVKSYFDLILVHGDPSFVQLQETFSRAEQLPCPLHYTGYVTEHTTHKSRRVRAMPAAEAEELNPAAPILASIGSGRYPNGHRMLKSVLQAAAELHGRLPNPFRIYAGPYIPDGVFRNLQQASAALPNVQMEKFTPDFQACMERASLSISMGGYNTVMNVLRTGVRALIFPYPSNDDQEQMIRARKLQERGVLGLIHPEDLESGALSGRILEALQSQPASIRLKLDGAEASASMLASFYRSRAPESAPETERVVQ